MADKVSALHLREVQAPSCRDVLRLLAPAAMKARQRARAYVQPKGTRHYKDPAELLYRNNRELTEQLTMFAKTKWGPDRQIEIDLSTKEILVNGRPVANFAIYQPHEKEFDPAEAIVP